MRMMDKLRKIAAGVGGIGILLIALYLAAFLFVILLVVGGIAAIWLHFRGGKLRKEFEQRQAQHRERTGQGGKTIDADYVVVEDRPLDVKPPDRP